MAKQPGKFSATNRAPQKKSLPSSPIFAGVFLFATVWAWSTLTFAAPTLTPLVTFNHDTNGANPIAGLLADGAGNLYGTTSYAGPGGYGTVFKLDAANNYALTTLVAFNLNNGADPDSKLIADGAGNLYGTTPFSNPGFGGMVFKLTAANNYAMTMLHVFNSGDGDNPRGGLIADIAGNLYGATEYGGGISNSGTAFKLDTANNYALTILATFTGPNGIFPNTRLIADSGGNLYGSTPDFGSGSPYPPTVYKLDAANNYAMMIASFNSVANPSGPLMADAAGNLYGTMQFGSPIVKGGAVFKLDASNYYALITLHTFDVPVEGTPQGELIADAAGNLYGTAYGTDPNSNRYGSVFKLDASNNYALTTLYNFTGGNDGQNPVAGLIADGAGNLYGTTKGGDTGAGYFGTVFKLSGTGFVVPEPATIILFAMGGLMLMSSGPRALKRL